MHAPTGLITCAKIPYGESTNPCRASNNALLRNQSARFFMSFGRQSPRHFEPQRFTMTFFARFRAGDSQRNRRAPLTPILEAELGGSLDRHKPEEDGRTPRRL